MASGISSRSRDMKLCNGAKNGVGNRSGLTRQPRPDQMQASELTKKADMGATVWLIDAEKGTVIALGLVP
jgi:hypothetical protein